MSRREALLLMAGMGGVFALPKIGLSQTQTQLKRAIPKGGELIPAMGMGTSRTFEVGTDPRVRKNVKEVLKHFVGMGGTLVDSSPMYGTAETVVGDLAAELGIQSKLFLATKVWTRGRKEGIRQMEESMERMRVKRIDLIQVHNLVDWKTQLETLHEWKETGRIRYVGITHYVPRAFDDLEHIMEKEDLDFVQLPYSISTRGAEKRLLPLAREKKIAVLVNRPFEKGDMFKKVRGKALPQWVSEFDCQSWGQFFLKFILSHPDVTCAIPATSKPKHLKDNMQAGYGRLPDPTMRRKMMEYLKSI